MKIVEKKVVIVAFFLVLLAILTVTKGGFEKEAPGLSEDGTSQSPSYEEIPTAVENISQDTDEWVIEVTGLVEKPMNITLSQLKEMPQTAVFSELYCVAYPGKARKQGLWKGVKLSYILKQAGVKDGAIKVAFYARDGFTTDLTIEEALTNDELIIAYEFNNKPIEPRLIAPGMWGYKWIKYLIKIEVVDYNFLGTYESEGYPDDAYIGEKP